ncbi:MAG: hypothetical protein K5873_04580 [Treponema sp.]|nr:hypothetical protein [Treponema sp.]
MKFKSITLAIFLFFLAFSSYARAGIGASFSYSISTDPHSFLSFSGRSDISPWSIFMNAHLTDNTISLFADNWFVNERLAEHVDYFVLWGMSFGATFEDDKKAFCTGARFGAGFDFFFFGRHLELFTQAVWNPYFGFKKEDGDYGPVIKPVNFPCTAGLRIWL